ncbi:MAG: glycosyltransferase [Planctomycetota bacterium]
MLAAMLVISVTAAFVMSPETAWWTFNVLLLGGFVLIVSSKIFSVLAGLMLHDIETVSDEELAELSDDDLPVYTILIPMYREPKMVPRMMDAMKAMDYPSDRLDVKLLLEEKDDETRAAAAACAMPDFVEVIAVPPGKPQTKPRACNFGLDRARGELVVIYDAEDRPEPDQLKKAVAVFRRSPEKLSCLQACLNYYNPKQNLLTRWFTLEYSTWFDLFLPGLHALHAPIPLGGTSNHFRCGVLRDLDGWDPWNVTEDCDLGLRLARRGHDTRVLESTTWEEAASTLAAWVPQRSRWVKGYWQTLLVHTRNPLRGLRELGLWKFAMMLLVVGGHVYSLALHPLCWLALAISLLRGESLFHPGAPYTALLFVAATLMVACNLVFIAMHAIAAWQRRQPGLWLAAAVLPVYWMLMSVAAWKGILQYLWAPFKWEKTPHGLGDAASADLAASWQPPIRVSASSLAARMFSFSIIAMLLVTLVAACLWIPLQLRFDEQIARNALTFDGPYAEVETAVDANWMNAGNVVFSASLPDEVEADTELFKAIVYVKVTDGEWYQLQTEDCLRHGDVVTVTAPLHDSEWTTRGNTRPWGPWCLRRVRAVGLRLFSHDQALTEINVRQLRLDGQRPPVESLTAEILNAPTSAERMSMQTVRFALSREYANPFDPDQIDAMAEIMSPDGAISNAAAFYTQDFEAAVVDGDEVLTATGAPHWQFRFTPRTAGPHRWRLRVSDSYGDRVKSVWHDVAVSDAESKGFVRVDPDDHRFFSFDDGTFFYPIPMTIRSPHDERQPLDADYPVPGAASGTPTMRDYIDRMQGSGMNLARVWMAPWFGGIEWKDTVKGYHGMGQYNLRNAQRLDWVLAHAREKGVYVDLLLQNHGSFTTYYDVDWGENPYNARNGGPLRRPQEVLRDEKARKLFRNRLRYTAARWGADPAIFGWTMWSEIDAVDRRTYWPRRWHAEMVPYFKRFDTGGHPVSTHFVSARGDAGIWEQESIDYVQVAAYAYQEGIVDKFVDAGEWMSRFDKPGIIEEYGAGALGGNMAPMSQSIHDGLWLGLMQPIAAAPMAWWWNLVFEKDLARFHKSAAAFVGDTDLRHRQWRTGTVELAGSSRLRAAVRWSDNLVWAWVYPRKDVALTYSGWIDWKEHPEVLNRAYARRVGDRYDPVNDRKPERFSAINDCSFRLRNMKEGTYRVEFWETWGSGVVTSVLVESEDGEITVALPQLTRDIAVKVVYISEPES